SATFSNPDRSTSSRRTSAITCLIVDRYGPGSPPKGSNEFLIARAAKTTNLSLPSVPFLRSVTSQARSAFNWWGESPWRPWLGWPIMSADLTVLAVKLPPLLRAPCPLPVLVVIENIGTDPADRTPFDVTIDLGFAEALVASFETTVR